MKIFFLIGVLCGAALASDYQYLDEVSSHSSSKYDSQPQHQYYQPPRYGYYPRYARGYKTDVPVYGELYQPKPVSAPIIHRPKPFYLPKPKIVVAPLKPAKYDPKLAMYEHSEPVYGPVDYYGGHQRTGYSSQPRYYPQPEPQYYPQPVYYQPHYPRYARGYKTDVPVYGELYQPKPVSAPIIKRTKPFYLPKPKIVVAPHKPKGYY